MDSSRKGFMMLRDSLSPEQRRLFSKKICCDIINSEQYKKARNIMCYMAIGSEVSLEHLMDIALAQGKRVLLPVCDKDSRTMVARYYNGEFIKGAYGINEPTGEIGIPDLIICPMLAFNTKRYRMGYGAGYYDKYLTDLIKNNVNAVFFGAAFSVQKADITPQSHDVPLERIYTEEEIF